jgi:hypothetical protein
MRTPWILGVLSLCGVLLGAGAGRAEPIFSDRIIVTDAAGKTILDVTRNESTPNLPELAVTTGGLVVPHNKLNVAAGVILTDAKNPDFNSDYVKVSVASGRVNDTLFIVFKSNPDEKSLALPNDFPKDAAARIAETGQLQDVTANLFPAYANAGQAAPFEVQVQSDLDKPAPAPEPATLTLFAAGALAVGACAWRNRRATA